MCTNLGSSTKSNLSLVSESCLEKRGKSEYEGNYCSFSYLFCLDDSGAILLPVQPGRWQFVLHPAAGQELGQGFLFLSFAR